MPIYEYVCQSCGHQLEAMQKFSDAPLTDCPACHQSALNKIVSSTSFQLKGTGWYVTDIRDKNKPKPPSDTASSASADAPSKNTQDTKDTKAE